MGKELTNRQLAEALGYALEKAEVNIKQATTRLENERKKIDTFNIDTEGISQLFKEGNEALRQTTEKCVTDLYKLRNSKPRDVQIKEWIFYGFMILATVGSLIFAGYSYYKRSKLEKENEKLVNIVSNVSDFFEAHPKEKKTLEEWNK